MISIIVAMAENRVIGSNKELPWRIPEDLKYFKRVTMCHPIIMGWKTFESIGRPLPGRENIVISTQEDYVAEGCTVLHSVEEVMALQGKNPGEEYFVIGGAEVYKAILPFADRLYITFIYEDFEGDTVFPPFNMNEWELVSREKGLKNEENPYDYEFLVYERKRA